MSRDLFQHPWETHLEPWIIVLGILVASPAVAVDVIPNGSFPGNITGWTEVPVVSNGTLAYDGSVGGVSAGSLRFMTDTNRNRNYQADAVTDLFQDINATDTVWYSYNPLREFGVSSPHPGPLRPYQRTTATCSWVFQDIRWSGLPNMSGRSA